MYIGDIEYNKAAATEESLSLNSRHGIATCLFENNIEAIEHSWKIGFEIKNGPHTLFAGLLLTKGDFV